MRAITTHHTNDVNKLLTLEADARDEKNGNASHIYQISWPHPECDPGTDMQAVELPFQHGPIGEVGVNGLTNEVLLAIVIDRLEGFQTSKWACEENAQALSYCKEALAQLELRTLARTARGVEGTHNV